MKFGRYIFLLLTLHCFFASAQDNMGIANSNYAPTNTILLNPSSSADSKAFIDFNIIGSSIFAMNNYVFLSGGLLKMAQTASNTGDPAEIQYNTFNSSYKTHIDFQLHGPSLSFSYGKFGVGIYTSIRSASSVGGVPRHLIDLAQNGLGFESLFGQEFTVHNVRVGSLTWLEYGGNFSYIVQQKGRDIVTVGGTIKRLNGITGAGVNIQNWKFSLDNDSILDSYEFQGKYGIPNLDADAEINGASDVLGKGSGIGLDIGFNYKKMLKGSRGYRPHTKKGCELRDYKYKFGASLLDIGRIKIKDGFYREISISDSIAWGDFDEDITTIQQAEEEIMLLIDENSTVETSYKVLLPTAFSAQFDYNFGYGLYANATLVYGFNRKKRLGVERASTFAITPRYERRQVEVALPLSVYDYEKLRLGVALRVYSVIIGTDHLGSFIGKKDLYGTDLYFSFKYTMFRPWYCKNKVKGQKRRKGKSNPCPSW